MGKEKHESLNARPVENYNSTEMVCETDLKLNDVFNNSLNDRVVIAKDKSGLYVTGKSFIGTNNLDPYKVYNRISVEEQDGNYCFKTFKISVK